MGFKRLALPSLFVLAAILGFAGCRASNDADGEGDRTNGGSPATIVVRDGKPVGGVRNLKYHVGEQIHLRVRSDVSDVVFVHYAELKKNIAAGGSVSFSFRAKERVLFAVYLENREEQIAEIRILP